MRIAMAMKNIHSLKIIRQGGQLLLEATNKDLLVQRHTIRLTEDLLHMGVPKNLHLVLRLFSQFLD